MEVTSKQRKICFVTADLSAGGAERVMATLVNNMADENVCQIHLLTLVGGPMFYHVSPKIEVHRPEFEYKRLPRILAIIRVFLFVRNKLKDIRPYSLLSFGGRYNAFVIFATFRLGIKTYVSDRSRPGIRYGVVQGLLNPLIYRWASGIIAQTNAAREHVIRQTGHSSVFVVANPIPDYYDASVKKQKVILNVGRFITSKQQDLLIRIFSISDPGEWQLWFLGDGENLERCKRVAGALGLDGKVRFLGTRADVRKFYQQADIFAFTSASEGFPNALGEGMSAGCACISFDCIAGPSDLIEHGVDGILVRLNDIQDFSRGLKQLMSDEPFRKRLADRARLSMKKFEEKSIVKRFSQILNA